MRRWTSWAMLLALAAPAASATDAAGALGDARPLPFLSDDYPAALRDARQRGLPLFIEAWAPW